MSFKDIKYYDDRFLIWRVYGRGTPNLICSQALCFNKNIMRRFRYSQSLYS